MKPSMGRPQGPLPQHVALIMDGNGRWARRAGLPRLRGHEAGIEAVRDVVEASAAWGIAHLTLYAFSLENLHRPTEEVDGLMAFLDHFLRAEVASLREQGIRLKAIGLREALPAAVQHTLQEVEEATAAGDGMTLRLALAYGGRQEIALAARRLAEEVQRGEREADSICPEAIAAALHDPSMPDPDLIIRTAGELRLSNFLLWQASYAEFLFSELLWPDFRREHLAQALVDYQHRVRRFGRVLRGDPAAEKPA